MVSKFLVFIPFVILVIQSSCNPFSDITYDILRPAKYSVSPHVTSIVLVDNAALYRDTAINLINIDFHDAYNLKGFSEKDIKKHDAIIADFFKKIREDSAFIDDYSLIVLKELKEELDYRQFFDTVLVDTIQHKVLAGGKLFKPLSREQIEAICDEFNADAILSLEGFKYRNEIKLFAYDRFLCTGLFEASTSQYWRYYERRPLESGIKYMHQDTIYWKARSATPIGVVSAFPKFNESAHELGEYTACEFAHFIAPHWETVTRRMYTSGNKSFLHATDFIRAEDWENAEKLWLGVYEEGSIKSRSRAALNIALYKEKMGEIEESNLWTQRCKDLLSLKDYVSLEDDKDYVSWYSKQLSIRLKELGRLKEQMGS